MYKQHVSSQGPTSQLSQPTKHARLLALSLSHSYLVVLPEL